MARITRPNDDDKPRKKNTLSHRSAPKIEAGSTARPVEKITLHKRNTARPTTLDHHLEGEPPSDFGDIPLDEAPFESNQPRTGKPPAPWTAQAIDAFGPNGSLSQNLPGYEIRPGQSQMAASVTRAFADGRHAVVEAGTGVGKSLAYLIPAVLSERQVIISTATRSLQDQLWRKDLPFLRKVLGNFSAAIVKGMSNYICLDRWRELNEQLDLSNGAIGEISQWIEETDSGELDELMGKYPQEFIGQFGIDSDSCLGTACRFAEKECFVMQARRRARESQIVVANHSLILSDLSIKAATAGKVGLLPNVSAYVIDEAHSLEDAATGAFEKRLTNYGVPRFCSDRVLHRYVDVGRLGPIQALSDTVFDEIGRVSRARRFIIDRGIDSAKELSKGLDDLATHLSNNRQAAELTSEEEMARYEKLIQRAISLSELTATLGLASPPAGHVRFAERSEGHAQVRLVVHVAPIEVAERLGQHLFRGDFEQNGKADGKNDGESAAERPAASDRSIICTSATLSTSVGPSGFNYFRLRVGCPDDALQVQAPSPFDFQTQALLYLPPSMPEPRPGFNPEWDEAVEREIIGLLEASGGRAFLLFTSGQALQRTYTALEKRLPYPLFVQGQKSRAQTLGQFRETPGAVLFGLRSFWEGVDVPGDALSLVVIDKLPFAVPDDPVVQARVDRIKAEGGNWFGDFTLPAATLQLKQGFGRLIRRRTDRGVVAILDPRLRTKFYGKTVLKGLPPAPVVSDIGRVRAFFEQARNENRD